MSEEYELAAGYYSDRIRELESEVERLKIENKDLKKRLIDPNLIYPGKDDTNVFPEE